MIWAQESAAREDQVVGRSAWMSDSSIELVGERELAEVLVLAGKLDRASDREDM